MERDSDLEQFLPYQLSRAADAALHCFRDRAGVLADVSGSEWQVLRALSRQVSLPARDIAAQSGLNKTKVSRAVVSLERRHWLVRSRDEKDRRLEHLQLTPEGLKSHHALTEAARNCTGMIVAMVGKDVIETLQHALLVLEDALDDHDASL